MNIPKFKQYLQRLRDANGEDKIALFMDNLSAHKSKKTKMEMIRLGFRCIFNISYSPQFNPIEHTFSKIKAKFKALRAQKLTGVLQADHRGLIARAVQSVRKQDVVNCVKHVEKLLI